MIGYFNWGKMGHTRRSMEDSGNEGDSNCADPDKEVSEKKNIIALLRDFSCDILVENVAFFLPFSKKLSQAKSKSCRLTALAEKSLRQPSI